MQINNSMRTALVALVLVLASALVAQTSNTQRVRFKRGSNKAVLKGAVLRDESAGYILGARGGQTMIVRITSLEKNAVFTILGPDSAPLPGADDERDATSWAGELPSDGDYSIWVSPTRGNATYTLEVTIR